MTDTAKEVRITADIPADLWQEFEKVMAFHRINKSGVTRKDFISEAIREKLEREREQ